MNLNVLNNPGWHALNSKHSHLAIRGRLAVRYPSDVLMGVAMADYNQEGLDDLWQLVGEKEAVAFINDGRPPQFEGWKILFAGAVPQMVCLDLTSDSKIDALRLTADDVPEMLALVNLTKPGPFLPRTIELGDYWGVRREGQLVAMAGERMHLDGFCEISAVCTHPNFQGSGYGGALSTLVARHIMDRGEIPFLHHDPSNHGARRLYEKLGFQKRRDLNIVFFRKAKK